MLQHSSHQNGNVIQKGNAYQLGRGGGETQKSIGNNHNLLMNRTVGSHNFSSQFSVDVFFKPQSLLEREPPRQSSRQM